MQLGQKIMQPARKAKIGNVMLFIFCQLLLQVFFTFVLSKFSIMFMYIGRTRMIQDIMHQDNYNRCEL